MLMLALDMRTIEYMLEPVLPRERVYIILRRICTSILHISICKTSYNTFFSSTCLDRLHLKTDKDTTHSR